MAHRVCRPPVGITEAASGHAGRQAPWPCLPDWWAHVVLAAYMLTHQSTVCIGGMIAAPCGKAIHPKGLLKQGHVQEIPAVEELWAPGLHMAGYRRGCTCVRFLLSALVLQPFRSGQHLCIQPAGIGVQAPVRMQVLQIAQAGQLWSMRITPAQARDLQVQGLNP